jgi:hypothetical protein
MAGKLSSADKNSLDNSNVTNDGQQNNQHNKEPESHSEADDKSDVLFETEALWVLRWAEERKNRLVNS